MRSKIKLIFLIASVKAGPFEDWQIISKQRTIDQKLKKIQEKHEKRKNRRVKNSEIIQ